MSRYLSNLLFIPLVIALTSQSQAQTYEAGLMVGSSYYLGDFNPTTHFVNPEPVVGLFARYNLSNHIAFRAGLNHGIVTGSDADSPYSVTGPGSTFDFRTNITELSIIGEVNFLPFIAGDDDSRYTTFLFAGTGAFSFDNEHINRKYRRLSYLFGVGLKFDFSDRLAGGIDWGLRQTATDKLDGAPEVGNPKNDDWYSFAGLSFIFRFRDRSGAICPY